MAGRPSKKRKDKANDGQPYEPSAAELLKAAKDHSKKSIFAAYEKLSPALQELSMIANDRAELLQFEGEMDHPEER